MKMKDSYMKYRIIQIFFSILLLLVFSNRGFTEVIEKDKIDKATSSTMAGEEINWLVISSGGVRGTSTDLVLTNTVGQSTVSFGTTTDMQLNLGFWQSFTTNHLGCCIGNRGNIDGGPDDGTCV